MDKEQYRITIEQHHEKRSRWQAVTTEHKNQSGKWQEVSFETTPSFIDTKYGKMSKLLKGSDGRLWKYADVVVWLTV